MFKYLLLILLLVFQSALCSDTIEDETVVFGANEAPPFFSQKLPYDGMAGEILHAISKAANVNSKIIYKPLSRNVSDETNNDLGNPDFFIINQDFAHIIPIALYHVSFYYYAPNHKDKIKFKSISDLKGLKIGILKGTLVDTTFFEQNGFSFEESYAQESLFKKLKLGRVDIVIEVELVAQRIIKNIFKEESENFISISVSKFSQPIAIMLSQETPNVQSISDRYCEGLKSIVKDGTYEEILKKYYSNGKLPDEWFEDLKRFELLYRVDERGYSCLN